MEGALIQLGTLGVNERERDQIRRKVLNMFEQFRQSMSLGINEAMPLFCKEYNNKRLIGVDNDVYKVVPSFSKTTFFGWKRQLTELGHIGGAYKHEPVNCIDTQPEVKKAILGILYNFPSAKPRHIEQALKARFSQVEGGVLDRKTNQVFDMTLPSYQVVQRWIKDWKVKNSVVYQAMQSPDKSKNIHMPAFGDADADVLRLNQRWEIDATPADVMLSDGRYSVIGMIDVYSRRVIVLVSKYPKGVVHGSLMRRCLLDWGVCEEVKTDNGADFVGNYFSRVLSLLGIAHTVCDPFSGWQKPHIERFFRTMSHSFVMEMSDAFVGHNVAERQDIRSRRSFSERLMKKNEVVEIPITADELQKQIDQWIEHI